MQPQITVQTAQSKSGASTIIIILIAFVLLIIALGGDVQGAIASLLKWLTGGAIDTTALLANKNNKSSTKAKSKATKPTTKTETSKTKAKSQTKISLLPSNQYAPVDQLTPAGKWMEGLMGGNAGTAATAGAGAAAAGASGIGGLVLVP